MNSDLQYDVQTFERLLGEYQESVVEHHLALEKAATAKDRLRVFAMAALEEANGVLIRTRKRGQ